MPIGSLDLCCVSRVYVIHLLHHVVNSRYSGGGSLRIGSPVVDRSVVDRSVMDHSVVDRYVVDRSGSESRYVVHTNYMSTQLCVHTIKRYTHRMDCDQPLDSLIGHSPSNRRHFRDLACLMILTIHSSSLIPYSSLFHCRYRCSNPDDVHLSSDLVLKTW